MARETIQEYRRRKDDFMRQHQNSPIPARLRAQFDGLDYYPDDTAMIFTVPLEPDPERLEVVMQTSNGSERVYERLGWVSLETPAGIIRLAVFAHPGDPQPEELFVPFRDATSGKETYGAGRYLEARFDGTDVMIDLNLAYNPYCAYADGWSCPVPPLENWLSVSVRAGERAFKVPV